MARQKPKQAVLATPLLVALEAKKPHILDERPAGASTMRELVNQLGMSRSAVTKMLNEMGNVKQSWVRLNDSAGHLTIVYWIEEA